ncbi:NAD(P)-binding protein [Xylaria intraflava]|nr:NAD(P)-binding protein [Xylaria intraflava]
MSVITNVALAGATGNLGTPILEHLLKSGFRVTVLTRQDSTHRFPANVAVKAVDYGSVESLAAALQGQDAVVSALGFGGFSKQLPLVEAAAKARVKRFIPSEFGANSENPKTSKLPIFADKAAVREALIKEAAKGSLSYTFINTGPFFEMSLKSGLSLDPVNKSVTLYDGGERPYSVTTLEGLGRAVVGTLGKLEETRNRAVYIQSAAPTLKRLKATAEKVTGTAWQAKEVSIENDVLAPVSIEQKKKTADPNRPFLPFLIASIWGEGYGGHFEKLDNELLGIKELTEAEIESAVAAATK